MFKPKVEPVQSAVVEKPNLDRDTAVATEAVVLATARETVGENGRLIVELLDQSTQYFANSDRVPEHQEGEAA